MATLQKCGNRRSKPIIDDAAVSVSYRASLSSPEWTQFTIRLSVDLDVPAYRLEIDRKEAAYLIEQLHEFIHTSAV